MASLEPNLDKDPNPNEDAKDPSDPNDDPESDGVLVSGAKLTVHA